MRNAELSQSLLTSAATRFMEREHLQKLDVSWGHERWGETPSSPDFYPLEITARRSLAAPFMVLMSDSGIVETFHEPDSGRDIALRCPRPREAAGGIIAPLSAARTAQRAVPTRFRRGRRSAPSLPGSGFKAR